jgi:hypothetical protein
VEFLEGMLNGGKEEQTLLLMVKQPQVVAVEVRVRVLVVLTKQTGVLGEVLTHILMLMVLVFQDKAIEEVVLLPIVQIMRLAVVVELAV